MRFRSAFGHVWSIEFSIAAVVFVAVVAAILSALVLSFRRVRKGKPPSSRTENSKLEIAYATIIAFIAIFVISLSFSSSAKETAAVAHPALTVKVIGFQWCWRFVYPVQNVTVSATCNSGHYPTLVVPTGTSIQLQVTSNDVIHSWWVPHLRYKTDAFPNHVNLVNFSLSRAGRWVGRCAEFCGLYHYSMDFSLQAVSPSQFAAWLKRPSAAGVA